MRPTISQYAQALEELTESAEPKKVSEVMDDFMRFLKRRGEAKKGVAILKRVEERENLRTETVVVQVITAHAITEGVKEKLEKQVKKIFGGKKVELEYQKDPEVIGGVKLQTAEALYDATVATELRALKNILLKG